MASEGLKFQLDGVKRGSLGYKMILQQNYPSALGYNKYTISIDNEVAPELKGFKNNELVFPQYIPKEKRPEIVKLYNKLKKMCPECSQAPVIITENPITVPYITGISSIRQFASGYPQCSEGMEFDSNLVICVKKKAALNLLEQNLCEIPSWFDKSVARLENIAKNYAVALSDVDSKECKKTYVLSLIGAIEGALK